MHGRTHFQPSTGHSAARMDFSAGTPGQRRPTGRSGSSTDGRDGFKQWERALADADAEHGKLAALEQTRPAPLTSQERSILARLARDLPRLWAAATTTSRDRKELVRTLLRM